MSVLLIAPSPVLTRTKFSEEKILAAVARIGFPTPPNRQPTKAKRHTLRSIAYTVLFVHRARQVYAILVTFLLLDSRMT